MIEENYIKVMTNNYRHFHVSRAQIPSAAFLISAVFPIFQIVNRQCFDFEFNWLMVFFIFLLYRNNLQSLVLNVLLA